MPSLPDAHSARKSERSPAEKSLAARKAALTRWAQEPDRLTATAAGRQAAEARFERQVDPDGTLTPEDRAKRADAARRAFFAGLALKSAVARRAKREQGGAE